MFQPARQIGQAHYCQTSGCPSICRPENRKTRNYSMFARTIQSIAHQFDSLEAIYASIESDRTVFMDTLRESGTEFGCPSLCGTCCLGFTPDLTRVEASYMASWILTEVHGPASGEDLEALASALGKTCHNSSVPGTCPFYDPSRPGKNCTVYPARPLICRLFGYSGNKNREGKTILSFCRYMPNARTTMGSVLDRPQSANPVPEWLQHADVPVMAEYGWKMRSIPGNDGTAHLVTHSLPREISRLILLNRYESEVIAGMLAGDRTETVQSTA